MINQTISHYKILEKLGEGGMGVLYKAEDILLRRIVALKFLPTHSTNDTEARERFIHEAQAASALDHPNICTIYEIGTTTEGQMFIAMAYYQGKTLREKVVEGPVPVDDAVEIALQVARGLRQAHLAGIIHRDIKSTNIIVTQDGVAKILDFGLAKLQGRTQVTKPGTTVGTVAYMSPEQVRGEEADLRSDIWSLGVVMYEMLAGRVPFKGDYDAAVFYGILNENPRSLGEQYRAISPAISGIVTRALQKSVRERYQKMEELLADLEQGMESDKNLQSLIPGFGDNSRRIKWIVGSLFLIASLMILIFIFRSKNIWNGSNPHLFPQSANRTKIVSPDTLYIPSIRSDTSDIHYLSSSFGELPLRRSIPVSDSLCRQLDRKLLSGLISGLYPDYVVLTQNDIEKTFARNGHSMPQIRSYEIKGNSFPSKAMHTFIDSVGWKGLICVYVLKINPGEDHLLYCVRLDAYIPPVIWSKSYVMNLDAFPDTLIKTLHYNLDVTKHMALQATVISAQKENVLLKKETGETYLREGTILITERSYRRYHSSSDSGVVLRRQDLTEAMIYFRQHPDWTSHTVIDSADYFWTPEEIHDIEHGILRVGGDGILVSLGIEIRITDVYDSTALGVIMNRKYPWVELRSGDECRLR